MACKKSLPNIQLRKLTVDDLPWIFAFEMEPEGHQMAVVHPRSPESFDATWTSILRDESILVRGIVADGMLVGHISSFPSDGHHLVGYWLGREYWGRGIATSALRLFLDKLPVRPLHARVATSNVASLRVLEKCGFRVIRREWSVATDRYPACEEAILELQ
jgi:RimJ/RimL family protein N-acetyltransferase